MPALTLVLPTEAKPSVSMSPVARLTRLRLPAWAVVVLVVVAGGAGFAYGRYKPAHHYVSYFGYPMVLDTTTGKACYATRTKVAEPSGMQASAFVPAYDGADRPETYVPNGPSVPLCGQE